MTKNRKAQNAGGQKSRMPSPNAKPKPKARPSAMQIETPTITHAEFVEAFTTNATGAFEILCPVKGYMINPGSRLFPWLAGIAPLYEKYTFESLSISVKTGASTVTSGRYYVCLDTDPSDPPPLNVREMMAMKIKNSGTIYSNMELQVPVADLNAGMLWRYTLPRNGVVTEPRTMAAGRLYIATSGTDTAVPIELHVRYRVKFMTPQLQEFQMYESQAPQENDIVLAASTDVVVPKALTSDRKLQAVQTAMGSIPTLTGGIMASTLTTATPMCYDLRGMTKGMLAFANTLAVVGETPSSVCATPADVGADIYDGSGAYLGTDASLKRNVVRGPYHSATYAASQRGAYSYTLDIAAVLETFGATVAFLLPWVRSAVSGTASHSLFTKLEL